jgi:hypothetical protein
LASAGISPEEYSVDQRVDFLTAILRELSADDLETASVVIQSLKDRHYHKEKKVLK